MSNKVLIVSEGKHGATEEIAQRIGKVLKDAGMEANVLSAKAVRNIESYDAVVIGSSLYVGMWRKNVVKFLKSSQTDLSQKPVWLFSSGPTGEGDPVQLVKGRKYPPKLQLVMDAIQPKDITVFHGALFPEKLSGLEKWMISKVKAPVGDFRDWKSIEKWAQSIADALKQG